MMIMITNDDNDEGGGYVALPRPAIIMGQTCKTKIVCHNKILDSNYDAIKNPAKITAQYKAKQWLWRNGYNRPKNIC